MINLREKIIGIVILCCLFIGVGYIVYVNKIHLKVIQKIRWLSILSEIKHINNIYELTLESKISILKKGKLKKELTTSKEAYEKYINYCKRNDLVIPGILDVGINKGLIAGISWCRYRCSPYVYCDCWQRSRQIN